MASSSTTNRVRSLALALLSLGSLALLPAQARAQEPAPRQIRIIAVEREEDPFYETISGADGIQRTRHYRPFAGAELGVKDAASLGRAANVMITLDRRVLVPDADMTAAIKRAAEEGAAAVLLDVPSDDMQIAAKAMSAGRLALFNIRDKDDALRRDLCGTDLFHVIPSRSALTDALAQFAVYRNWRRVFLLVGPQEDDTALARSFENSAKKFGARIVDVKPFVMGNDPRNRQQTNVALMTAGSDFDVVFLADTLQDFGRYVPYRLARPRPVIGTEGLQAAAWHPASERYGAPQVNRRFERGAGRPMSEFDWSAWVAVKAIAEAVARNAALSAPEIVRALSDGPVSIEMSKGLPGSFRRWDHQLRQPIMLHTSNAVVDFAPFEGFLHERTTLDTLGLGENEVPCRR